MNRFGNILPYDKHRVTLDGGGGDFYINASHVAAIGNSGKEEEGRRFIAAQGPLAWTVDDFWRMICHHRVETILMLTECDRGGTRDRVILFRSLI